LDDLSKLEEKLDSLISVVSELKQKVEDLEERNTKLTSRDSEIKEKIAGLIEKIDNLLI
jgi:FtsZ-binding cell division protein ZapB